eukprot:Hpha_TRINITY_DN451_c0_g1::TRINITY_DN451_c0_g1_i1::g.27602::m.27602/K01623/ALDO; fructose-bisphosphate aldolase, class I
MTDPEEAKYLRSNQVPELIDAALRTVLDERPQGPHGGVCAVGARLHLWLERHCVDARWHDGDLPAPSPVPELEGMEEEDGSEGEVAVPKDDEESDAPVAHPLSRAVASNKAKELVATAESFCGGFKGALLSSVDPSTSSIQWLRERDVREPAAEDTRLAWRELTLSGQALTNYFSCVLMHPEALRQATETLRPFAEVVNQAGAIVGVTVDAGTKELEGASPGEQCSLVLDGWEEQAKKFFAQGCRAVHTKVVYRVQLGVMSEFLIHYNAHTIGAFAAVAQREGMVPVLGVEVDRDGTHDAGTAELALERALSSIAAAIPQHGAMWDKLVIAVSPAFPGHDCQYPARITDVAKGTLRALKNCIPPACLSILITDDGLQDEEQLASELLNETAQLKPPWEMAYLFGRCLEKTAVKLWGGLRAHAGEANACFSLRARMNFLALQARYSSAEDSRELKGLLGAVATF